MADPTVTPLFGVPINPAAPINALQPGGVVSAVPSAAVARGGPPAKYVEQDGKHKGAAGVVRDILGGLGDFLLTRLHMPAMYAPAQEKRKLAAAESGMDVDPIAAIQRVESINPTFGAKLRDQYIDNQRLAATQASTDEARKARLGLAQAAQDQRTRTYAASMLGSMSTWDETKRQQFYPQMRKQVLLAGQRQGVDLSSELPESYDGTALDAFIDGSVPVGTQRNQRLSETRIENQDRQAAARMSETRDHNDVTESQGAVRIAQGEARLGLARQKASAPRGAGRPARSSNIMTYVGEDGYRYAERTDGKTIRSTQKVRAPAAGKPTEGMRRSINGVVYVIKNGKPVKE